MSEEAENTTRDDGTEESGAITGSETQNELPLVFQCGKCDQIISDSTSWVNSIDELQIFTLREVVTESIEVSPKILITPFNEPDDPESAVTGDEGSTYCEIICSRCKSNIGRTYVSTPKDLDSIRNLFTFYKMKVKAYALGSIRGSSDVIQEDVKRLIRPGPNETSKRFAVLETVVLKLQQEIHELRQEIEVLQK